MKILQVERTTVRDSKKLSRCDHGKSVLIGTIHHRTAIPIIGDGGPPFEGEDHFEIVRYPKGEIELMVPILPDENPNILVAWRLPNCYELEGTAEILLEREFGSRTHESDDGSMIADHGLDMVAYLIVFKPGDRLKALPKEPSFGNYVSDGARNWVYFMHWTVRYGKPFLSVTRKTVEAVEKRKIKANAGK